MKTYGRIGLLRSYGNLQSYWTTATLWELTVVLDYYEAMENYSRIGLLNLGQLSTVKRGEKYFFTRNYSEIFAFIVGKFTLVTTYILHSFRV